MTTSPLRDRTGHDPFAPRVPQFPGSRFSRAGLSAEDTAKVRAEFDAMTASERRGFIDAVRAVSGTQLREQYGTPPLPPTPPVSQLEGYTIAQLEPLLEERQLPKGGRKAELIARLAPFAAAEPETPPAEVTNQDGGAPEGEDGQGVVQGEDGVQHTGTIPTQAAVAQAEQTAEAAPADPAASTGDATVTAGAADAATGDTPGA